MYKDGPVKRDQVEISIASQNPNDFEAANIHRPPYSISNYIGNNDSQFYPAVQPQIPSKQNWFCTCFSPSNYTGRMGFSVGFILIFAPLMWISTASLFAIAVIFAMVILCLLGLPFCLFMVYSWTWWTDDIFPIALIFWDYICCKSQRIKLLPTTKNYAGTFLKLVYLFLNIKLPLTPQSFANIKASQIADKKKLKLETVQFGLNLFVPLGDQSQFDPASPIIVYAKSFMTYLPMFDYFNAFALGENPVDWIMARIGNMYPVIYERWDDKLSDDALTRFCFNGVAAHRVETVFADESAGAPKTVKDGAKVKYFVLRTSQLAPLAVRKGFAHYGADVFFDTNYRPVKILMAGLAYEKLSLHSHQQEEGRIIVRPGDAEWANAKFVARSSLLTLVTVVDHLYGVHLQESNLLTIATREHLSKDHPVRRFLTAYQFGTIGVNANACNLLIKSRTLAQRTFAFDDQGFSVAMNSASDLMMPFSSVCKEAGYATAVDKVKCNQWLKDARGVDTPYNRQETALYEIHHKFVVDYLKLYYGADYRVAISRDQEVMDFMASYQMRLLALNPYTGSPPPPSHQQGAVLNGPYSKSSEAECGCLIEHVMANFILQVTQAHTQRGTVAVYAQDASWTAGKWVSGHSVGTKQTAIAQGLLLATTAMSKPNLMRPVPEERKVSGVFELTPPALSSIREESFSSWAKFFNPPSTPWDTKPAGIVTSAGPQAPEECFEAYQSELQDFSIVIDQYNTEKAMSERPFPWNMPVYSNNPKYHDCSVSV